ncbi:MAG: glycosyltransferase, partial [Pseudomonadota bacterium]
IERPDLKLIVVGTLGWDNDAVRHAFMPWLERGAMFLLNAVPTRDLRTLYAHAAATVCPSYGEGFDYSGVEAMASGGVAIASDLLVHREVYGDAALYFDPYSTAALTDTLARLLDDEDLGDRLRAQGAINAARYRPKVILPQWQRFLERVVETGRRGPSAR